VRSRLQMQGGRNGRSKSTKKLPRRDASNSGKRVEGRLESRQGPLSLPLQLITRRTLAIKGETLCQRKLQNITRRHQSITPTHPSITRKRLNTMRADITKRLRTMHIQREPTSFMREDTVKRRRKPILRSTAGNRQRQHAVRDPRAQPP
jgi:hypothetical protein